MSPPCLALINAYPQPMLTAFWDRVTPRGDFILVFWFFVFLLTPLLTALAGHAKKLLWQGVLVIVDTSHAFVFNKLNTSLAARC